MGKPLIFNRSTSAAVLCAFCMITFCGCSNVKPMALESPEPMDLSTKSIGLFTLRTLNQLKPGYEPFVSTIEITPKDTGKAMYFSPGKPHEQHNDGFLEYLVSLDLPPGTYSIGNVSGISTGILIYGSFCFPVDATFELPPDSIVYLGHVDMVNRKLVDGEKRAGSIFPLIDQAATGYSGGSFDITVSDRGGLDIPLFETRYPKLENFIISPNIMEK